MAQVWLCIFWLLMMMMMNKNNKKNWPKTSEQTNKQPIKQFTTRLFFNTNMGASNLTTNKNVKKSEINSDHHHHLK